MSDANSSLQIRVEVEGIQQIVNDFAAMQKQMASVAGGLSKAFQPGLAQLSTASTAAGVSLKQLRETSMLAREGFHGLESSAILLGGTRFPQLALGIMAAREAILGIRSASMLFKISLAEIAAPLAIIGAAVGVGYLGWKSYMSGVEDTTTTIKEMIEALDKVPALIDKINNLQKAGLISPAAAKEFADYLGQNPKKKLYRNGDGSYSPNPAPLEDRASSYAAQAGIPIQSARAIMVANPQPTANPAQANAYDESNLPPVSEAQVQSANKYREIQQQINSESLTGLAAQIQKIKEKNQSERDALVLAQQSSGNLIIGDQTAVALEKSRANEAREIAAAEAKADDERAKKFDDWVKKQGDAFLETLRQNQEKLKDEERITAEKQRQIQIQQEISRAKNAAALAAVQGNPLLTNSQKADQSVPLLKNQIADNALDMAQNQADAKSTTDLTAQLILKKEFVDLQVKSAELQNKLISAEGEHSLSFQLGQAVLQLQNMNNLAKEFGSLFENVINTSIRSVSSNLTGVIMGTESWQRALQNIYTTIVTDIVNGIIEIGVRWILMEAVTAASSKAVAAASVATLIPIAAAQSAILAVPATLATIASFGAAALAAPGEIALATSLTSAMALFSEGGYTGPGGKFDVAGIVHRGEYVMPADAVNRIGVGSLEAMRSGGSSSAALSGGTPGQPPKVIIVNDLGQLKREMEKSDWSHITVAHVLANKTKLGFKT